MKAAETEQVKFRLKKKKPKVVWTLNDTAKRLKFK